MVGAEAVAPVILSALMLERAVPLVLVKERVPAFLAPGLVLSALEMEQMAERPVESMALVALEQPAVRELA